MLITDIKVRIVQKEESKLRAVASITIDNCFVVHDIKILEGNDGCFVKMPSRKNADGQYKDIAHPINAQTREELVEMILSTATKQLDSNLKIKKACLMQAFFLITNIKI